MSTPVRIALDAMGGDHGPAVILAGAALARERRPEAEFLIYGREAEVRPHLDAHPRLAARSTLHHCEVSVRMDDRPSQALRKGRWKSSMWKAVEAVKTGEASVAVSAGNTGALMAMSVFCLRTLKGVERPAIAAIWPTSRGESVVLDVGATIGAEARHLVDLALMGAGMARLVLGVPRPKVGLLNVGTEEIKGLEPVREAGRTLREAALPELDYIGFVEGTDLGRGTADVVVTEGFSGNIALKTAEGTAKQVAGYLKDAMASSLRSKLGYLLARPAFDALRDKLDPRKINGGVFLGLDGLVVKSHGGTDAVGFASALDLAHELASGDLLGSLRASLARPLLRAEAEDAA